VRRFYQINELYVPQLEHRVFPLKSTGVKYSAVASVSSIRTRDVRTTLPHKRVSVQKLNVGQYVQHT